MGKRRCRAFTTVLVCVDHENSPVNVDGGVLGPPFPVVHDQLLCLAEVKGEVDFTTLPDH